VRVDSILRSRGSVTDHNIRLHKRPGFARLLADWVNVWHHGGEPLTNMHKLSWTLLLPFLLLFVQQGELRHEYGHYAEQAASCKKAPVDPDHCLQCLAYAQIAGVAKADLPQVMLLASLAFHFAPAVAVASADRDAVSPRSRGPPSL
jgi:hypothetical protein